MRKLAASLLAAPLALALPAPAAAQDAPPSPLSLEHRMLVRCSAAFAMIAHGQEAGNADALQYPSLAERGSEFFIRSSARVMDEANLTSDEIASVLEREAQDLWDNDQIGEIMPVCLRLLDQSGL